MHNLLMICIYIYILYTYTCNSCNMAMRDLPDVYACPGPKGSGPEGYVCPRPEGHRPEG